MGAKRWEPLNETGASRKKGARNMKGLTSLTFVIVVSILILGCDRGGVIGSKPGGSGSGRHDGPPQGHPSDFFPIAPGTRWVYEIEITGGPEPIRYEEVSWPVGGGKAVRYATRGFLGRPIGGPAGKRRTYRLEMSVKGSAKTQGPLQYPKGVELAVQEDELGVFRDHKKVFWATSESGRFMTNLVVTYDPDVAPGAPGGPFGRWGQGDGSALRLIFFADKPLTQIGIGEDPVDALLFVGIDADVPEHQGTECFHFVRTVKPAENQAGRDWVHFQQGFSEDTWFARGKGLVRLEQKVNGKTSMVWRLRSFSQDGLPGIQGNTSAPTKTSRHAFIQRMPVSLKYGYGDGTTPVLGIAAAATSEGEQCVDEDGERHIKVVLKPGAEAVSTPVACFKPGPGLPLLSGAGCRPMAAGGPPDEAVW